jgi:hypothetical protein
MKRRFFLTTALVAATAVAVLAAGGPAALEADLRRLPDSPARPPVA